MTYSSSLAVNRSRYAVRNQNAVSFSGSSVKLGPVSNTIILIVLACLLGMLYLSQVTKTNAYSYQINDLKQKQTKLSDEQRDLSVASARLQSLSTARDKGVQKGMVSVAPTGTVTQ